MVLVDALMRKTEQQLEDSGKVLQDILAAAADEKGEWYLPLTADQVRPPPPAGRAGGLGACNNNLSRCWAAAQLAVLGGGGQGRCAGGEVAVMRC